MKLEHSTIKCPHCGYDTGISRWEIDGDSLVCPHCDRIITYKDF